MIALSIVLTVLFIFMAVNISAIRKATDIGLLGSGLAERKCDFCAMACPPEAEICHRCGRNIGAWVRQGGRWWTKSLDGEWIYLEYGAWKPPDASHAPPTMDQMAGGRR